MKKSITLLLLFITFQTAVFAQRQTDLSVQVISPQDSALLLPLVQTSLSARVKNNGPGNLVAGDTLFFTTSLNANTTVFAVILDSPLVSGQSVDRFIDVFENNGLIPTDMAFPLCLTLLNPNTAGILIGNNPVLVTYSDNNLGNNENCITIILKANTTTSISEVQTEVSTPLSFYPNPADHVVHFKLRMALAGDVGIEVRTLDGRAVLKREMGQLLSNVDREFTFETSNLVPGIYVVVVKTAMGKRVGKLVVSRP